MGEEIYYDIIVNGLDTVATKVPEVYLMTIVYAILGRDSCQKVLVSKHRPCGEDRGESDDT